MITFKEFLSEKKMSGGVYAKALKRLEDEARIGFEIEVFVPTGSFYHREPDVDLGKPVRIDDMNTWNEFTAYFDTADKEDRIMADFEAWKVEQEDAWVDEHWRDYVTDDESKTAERDARRLALKRMPGSFTWQEWFDDKFMLPHDFISKYRLVPTYGWSDDGGVRRHRPESAGYHSGFKNTAKVMAEHLERALKTRVRVNATGYETWNLTHDSSIKDKNDVDYESGQDGVGVEIVSPPLPPTKAIEDLTTVLKLLDQFEIETNESTGIHVNISLPNLKDFDPLKLVLFMGDQHILEKFGRTTNPYTSSQLKQVIDSISMTGKIPRSAADLMRIGREGLQTTGKYFSVNLTHLPKYLEFRAAGGAGYHKRIHDIKEIVGRWLSAVELAADPTKHRREYLKKVMALVDKTYQANAQKEASEQSFNDWLLKKHRMLSQTIDAAETPGEKKVALRSLLIELGSESELPETVPFSWVKDVHALFRRFGVTIADVRAITKDGTPTYAVDAAARAFRLSK